MPIAAGMIRKPSTCSLPASLLMEQQGMTPSSSVEGLSPTGSTCSLGTVGHSHHHTHQHQYQQQQQHQQIRRTPTPSHSSRHSAAASHTPHSASVVVEQGRHVSKSESSMTNEGGSSVAIMDSAIVKAGPSFHSPPLTSPDSVASSSSSSRVDSSFPSEDVSIGSDISSENPLRVASGHGSATIVRRPAAASSGDKEKSSTCTPTRRQSSSENGAKANGPVDAAGSTSSSKGEREDLTSSWKSVGNVSNCSSWADEAVSSGEAANINRPEWANMSPPPPPPTTTNSGSNSNVSCSTSAPPLRQHTTATASGSSRGGGSSNSAGGQYQHHHKSQQSHHHHHHSHHHQSTPPSASSSSRTVHQIHSTNSLSDIIPIQTHPGQSSPFHSPPSSSSGSSSSSSNSASFSSPPVSLSSSSVLSGPSPSSKSGNSQQRPVESHPHSHSHSHPHSHPTSNTCTATTISTATHSAAKHKQSHASLAKRNSSESSANRSSPILQAAPPPSQQQVYVGGNRAPNIVGISPGSRVASGAAGGHNWIVRPLLPNHPVTVIGVPVANRSQHQVIHTASNPPVTIAHNGLMMKTAVPQQNRLPGTTATIVPATFVPTHYHHHQSVGGGGGGVGLVVCPPASINHIQGGSGGPPAMCFNCGKRGHLGNSCPGVTMETNNPDSKLYLILLNI